VLWSSTPEGEKGQRYLKERGISEETAREFDLGVAPEAWGTVRDFGERRGIPVQALLELGLLRQKEGGRPYDFFRDRLMFPIKDEQGKVIAFGGRTLCGDDRMYMNSPEVPGLYEKRRVLYGLDKAKKARPKRLVVVEGYMDVVVPHQAGRNEFVAALGTAFTPDQAKLARRYVDEVVILFDGDEAGAAAAQRALANLVGEQGLAVKVARLPDGMDPDEAVRKDPALLERALDEAEDVIAFLIEETLRGYDRSSPVGRERAIRAAIRLLGRIDDSIRMFTELRQVAHRFGLPEDVLREAISAAKGQDHQALQRSHERTQRRMGPPGPPREPNSGVSPDSVELCLLEAMLAVPDAAARIASRGGGPEAFTPGPGQTVAGAIFAVADEGPVEPARVMARLEDPSARDLCDHLIGRIDEAKNYERDQEGFDVLLRRITKRRREELVRRIRAAKDHETRAKLLAEQKALRAGPR
jgi:DNA primase